MWKIKIIKKNPEIAKTDISVYKAVHMCLEALHDTHRKAEMDTLF